LVGIGLFGEEQSQVLVTCAPENANSLQDLADGYGLMGARLLGTVGGDSVVIQMKDVMLISAPVTELKKDFSDALESQLAAEVIA
jgi:hypothetical protein